MYHNRMRHVGRVVLVVALWAAGNVCSAQSGSSAERIETIAGAEVRHALRPTGDLQLPADAVVVVPPALVRDAQVQAPTAAMPFVTPVGRPAEAEFTAYPGRPPPTVVPRQSTLAFYPCALCHLYLPANATPRVLAPAHDVGLNHGGGRFWCLTCHDPKDKNTLRTLRGTPVDFNNAWRICGQCHQARQKDWYFGGHGKRFYSWKGEPVRYDCTHCHNPHRPPFMRRKPQPPPPVRAGLQPMPRSAETNSPVWVRHMDRLINGGSNGQE